MFEALTCKHLVLTLEFVLFELERFIFLKCSTEIKVFIKYTVQQYNVAAK